MKICRSDILKKEFLEECFEVKFETGTLIWKKRPVSHFLTIKACRIWNTKYSGTVAGSTSWRTKGYFFKRVTICKMYFPVHHVLYTMYTGCMFDTDKFVIDHVDRNPLNNGIRNLRIVSQQQNTWNMAAAKSEDSLSRFKGVCYDKERSKWMLQIKKDGIKISGRFDCESSAAYLYRVFSENAYGDFSPDFLSEVEFPEDFDWKGITPAIKRVLSDISEETKNSHEVFFKGLASSVWTRVPKENNTGFPGVCLASPKAKAKTSRDLRKFIASVGNRKKTFTVSKYGYENAFKLACDWVRNNSPSGL